MQQAIMRFGLVAASALLSLALATSVASAMGTGESPPLVRDP